MTDVPAFPTKQYNRNIMQFEHTGGMTLRDYFAAQAMQGFASYIGPSMTFDSRAKTAYEWADAMMKAREEK